jgi:hypothetical protein
MIVDPEKRPTAAGLLDHPFLASVPPQRKLCAIVETIFVGASLRNNGF